MTGKNYPWGDTADSTLVNLWEKVQGNPESRIFSLPMDLDCMILQEMCGSGHQIFMTATIILLLLLKIPRVPKEADLR